jgi:hypothetical protein
LTCGILTGVGVDCRFNERGTRTEESETSSRHEKTAFRD